LKLNIFNSQFLAKTRGCLQICETNFFSTIYVGLSKGSFPDGSNVENSPNSYAMYIYEKWYFSISGMQYEVKLSNCQLKPICKGVGDVFGCGIMLGSTTTFSDNFPYIF
jgi:hypothetical protein